MATPSYVGQIASYYNSASVITFSMTTTAAVLAGDTIFVSSKGQGNYGVSCTDSAGNIYKVVGQSNTGPGAVLFGSVAKSALASGQTITVTMNVSAVNAQTCAFVFRNVALSGPPADAVASATTSSLSVTTGFVTPEQVSSIILSFATLNGIYSPTTTAPGFTKLSLTGSSIWQSVAWKQINSASVTPTNLTWSNTNTANWRCVTVALNATSGEFLNLF